MTSANIRVERLSIGDCSCTRQPQITIDQTMPICTGTTCGDVPCGQSVSCNPDPNTTVTVHCNWGGWRKVGENQFQPIIGVQ